APSEEGKGREITMQYAIPEYDNQEFIDTGTVLVEKEYPIILDEFSLKTTHAPIALQSTKQISYLEVYAFRNNTARRIKIKDVDQKRGIIYLIDRIREQDVVTVRYAYKEDYYTYKGFEKEVKK